MSKLYLKTSQQNTIRDERVEMISKGVHLDALVTNYNDPALHMPRMESVGVSRIDALDAPGEYKDFQMISDIQAPAMNGPVRMRGMGSGLDVPMKGFGGRTGRQAFMDGTLSQVLRDGVRMDGNSLLANWQTLIDAARIDLTIRKAMRPTIRELIYMVMDTPNATPTMKVDELYPYAAEFKENSGTGQAVEMVEATGGQSDTLDQIIYAAGFTYDLKKYLFDRTLDMTKLNDGIAIGEAGLKDHLACKPIFDYTYASAAQTAADATGATREEKLYLTIQNAIDDYEARRDPVTNRSLSATGAVILTSPAAAGHVAQILDGFTGVEVNVKKRPALSAISRVIGYEGERIVGRAKTVTYDDVPANKAYLIVPNRRMLIAIKRTLQMNVDASPDVLRLARELMAWWFCEGQYTAGIGYFVQEITLPTW